jgi:hypothetical protein
MSQLFGSDLRSGDILLEWNAGAVIHQVIRFGQKVMHRGTDEIIHAGILFDNRFLIESDKNGIAANDIYLQDKGYSFQVYRPKNSALAAGAATCAKVFFDIHARTGGLPYSVSGAIASIFKGAGVAPSASALDTAFSQMIQGKNHPFFCSQFVVFVFQFVAEQNNLAAGSLFSFADKAAPPSILAATLKRHSMFQEVGYLLANQR